jgi:hypothetical protein
MKSAVILASVAVLTVWASSHPSSSPPAERSASSDRPDPRDPAVLRSQFLRRMDEHIDAIATQSHLEARLAYDAVNPLPYLGVDADVVGDGLVLTAIYADTGAEACGLRAGDVLRAFDGVKLTTKASLARNVRKHRAGDRIVLEIERAGARSTISATLGVRPEEDEDESEQFPDLVVIPPVPAPLAFAFDQDKIGEMPAAFESALGGHGRLGDWRVVKSAEKSDAAVFLRQDDADKTGIRFPQAIVRDFDAADAVVKVRFRYASGRVDRAAGLILRWRNADNYYVARANALEGDVRIFRVVNGERRTLLGAIAKGATDDDRWHTLEFRAEGAKLTATLDGSAQATAFDSFFLRGRAGLWTKSDSRTEFDDLSLEPSL